MTWRKTVKRLVAQEDLNFLLTNRVPRRWLTLFVGWLSRIEHPWVVAGGLYLWRLCTNLDLGEARKQCFVSLRDVFTRELIATARPIEPDANVLVSPCDAIVGCCGEVIDGIVMQIKGSPYELQDLLADESLQQYYRNGRFVTLRLTSAMYHRFHAPFDCRITRVTYISGDTWNVNPVALRRIESLFCRNERAVIPCELANTGRVVTLVAVGAILVASIRLRFLATPLTLRYRGPNLLHCDAQLRKGEEMGWFELGSTILMFAPSGFLPTSRLHDGAKIRMGEPLLNLPS